MTKITKIIITVLAVVGVGIGIILAGISTQESLPHFDARLASCKAFPNNSTQNVVETTRLSINTPRNMYPDGNISFNFETVSGNATAGYISNGGLPGNSFEATPECWSTYVDFEGNGEVDLKIKSVVKNEPDYFVRFIVGPAELGRNAGPVHSNQTILYRNGQYGFTFKLPETWQGYSIIADEWQGYETGGLHGDVNTEKGPQIIIRNPQWTSENNWQPIPIMVFTLSQWKALQEMKFIVSAAPILPTELGRNAHYVFALPARYNYAYTTGWEEVEKILESKPLQAF